MKLEDVSDKRLDPASMEVASCVYMPAFCMIVDRLLLDLLIMKMTLMIITCKTATVRAVGNMIERIDTPRECFCMDCLLIFTPLFCADPAKAVVTVSGQRL